MTSLEARALVIASLPTLTGDLARHVHELLRASSYVMAARLILAAEIDLGLSN